MVRIKLTKRYVRANRRLKVWGCGHDQFRVNQVTVAPTNFHMWIEAVRAFFSRCIIPTPLVDRHLDSRWCLWKPPKTTSSVTYLPEHILYISVEVAWFTVT